MHCTLKFKKVQVSNMVSIKRNTCFIHGNTSRFLKTPYKQQKVNKIPTYSPKNMPNKKLSKKITKVHLKPYLTFLPQVFLSNIYMDFQKDRVKWQHSMVNRQRLTPRLTTTFSEITQPVAIHNNFFMSFLDTVSQWNKLDKKKPKRKSH